MGSNGIGSKSNCILFNNLISIWIDGDQLGSDGILNAISGRFGWDRLGSIGISWDRLGSVGMGRD